MKKRIFIISVVLAAGFLLAASQPSRADMGACLLLKEETGVIPGYNAPAVGNGYAMVKLGIVADYNDLRQKCTKTVFQQIISQYCQQNPSPWGFERIALYDNNGNLLAPPGQPPWTDQQLFCSALFNGACVITDTSGRINTINYKEPEVGQGYVMKKMGQTNPTDIDALTQKCTDAIFREMMPKYCQNSQNDTRPIHFQWAASIFRPDGTYVVGRCPHDNCDIHDLCLPDLTVLGVVAERTSVANVGPFGVNKEPTDVKVKVKNIGFAKASAAEVVIGMVNQSNQTTVLAKGASKPLAPGEEGLVNLSPTGAKVTEADCLGRDVIKIEAVIDPKNLIQELSNSNNSFMAQKIDCSVKTGPQIKPKLPIKK